MISGRKAKNLRGRIGGVLAMGLEQQPPEKPKGMHWKTYNRLSEAANESAQLVYDYWRARNRAVLADLTHLREAHPRKLPRLDKHMRRDRRRQK